MFGFFKKKPEPTKPLSLVPKLQTHRIALMAVYRIMQNGNNVYILQEKTKDSDWISIDSSYDLEDMRRLRNALIDKALDEYENHLKQSEMIFIE